MDNYEVKPIAYDMTVEWIMKIHYAGRMPMVSHSFGLFRNNVLVGIVTYGLPASPWLCKGICGDGYKDSVIELNRLVLKDGLKNEASMLVGRSLKILPGKKVIVSYADTEWNHVGYVYQATNWLYTGKTKERTDMLSESGHSRHNGGNPELRQPRSAKHRYVTFVGTKREKAELRAALNYPVLPYPKGDSKKYEIDHELQGSQISML